MILHLFETCFCWKRDRNRATQLEAVGRSEVTICFCRWDRNKTVDGATKWARAALYDLGGDVVNHYVALYRFT
eukprot:5938131-Pyramimonas_sp.AAC.1